MSVIEIVVKSLVQEIKLAAISRADRGLKILRNSAIEVLSHDGSGRVYRNGHVASAPGKPPAPDTGNLRRNWRQQKHTVGDLKIVMQIKSRMFYEPFLEYGTRKMSARPFHKRVKGKARPKITKLFSNL